MQGLVARCTPLWAAIGVLVVTSSRQPKLDLLVLKNVIGLLSDGNESGIHCLTATNECLHVFIVFQANILGERLVFISDERGRA